MTLILLSDWMITFFLTFGVIIWLDGNIDVIIWVDDNDFIWMIILISSG
jgi:hypothetical protein